MKNRIHLIVTTLCAFTAGAGCVLEDGGPGGPEVTVAPQESTIIVTNGSSINGPLVNGSAATGTEVYIDAIVGNSADGSPLLGLTLTGSSLSAIRVSDGAVLSGAALDGATFATQTPAGLSIELRIDTNSASPSRYHAGSAVNLYTVSARGSGSGAWAPVCAGPSGEPALAIPLAGRWNYAQGVAKGGSTIDDPDWITFACSGFALYKCVDLGYEPWTIAGGEPLDDHHQACVRAHRADYCGDGRPFTVNGLSLNIFDDLGIQGDTESWLIESAWDARGARCLSRRRIQGGIVPDCASKLHECQSSPDWGHTLLVTETP